MKKKSNISVFIVTFIAFLLLISVSFAIVKNKAPANNVYTNGTNKTVLFIFNYTGGVKGPVVNCTLYVNSVSYGTNKSPNLNKNSTITANKSAALSSGTKSWNVTCFNGTGSSRLWSNLSTIFADRTAPVVSLSGPANGRNTSVLTQRMNWTATDAPFGKPLNCSIMLNSVLNQTQKTKPTGGLGYSYNGTLKSSALTRFANARYTWNVTCMDNSTNRLISTKRTFTIDDKKPNTTVIRPTILNEGVAYTINATVNDSLSGISNCALLVDGGVLVSSMNFRPGRRVDQVNTSKLTFTYPRNHTFSVNCTDAAGNNNASHVTVKINDTLTPGIVSSSVSATALSAVFAMNTDDVVNFSIYYGYASQRPWQNTIVVATTKTQNFTYTLNGLTENTLYYYNMSVCDIKSRCNVSSSSFTTLNNAGGGSSGGSGSSSSTTTTTETAVTGPTLLGITIQEPTAGMLAATAGASSSGSSSSGGSSGSGQAELVAPTTQKETAKPAVATVETKLSFWVWIRTLFSRVFGAFN